MHLDARLVSAQWLKVVLDVRGFHIFVGAREDAHLGCSHAHRPGAGKGILHADHHSSEQIIDLLVQGRYVNLVNGSDLKMILQVSADAGQSLDDGNFQSLQQGARTDA